MKLEPEDSWWNAVKVSGAKKSDEGLVVCFNLDPLAQDVVGKLFTCPYN